MNNNAFHQSSHWLDVVRKTTTDKKSGSFKQDNQLIIDWHVSDIVSPHLAQFKKDVSDLAAKKTATMEMQFLQKYPEALSSAGFFTNCKPLFEQEKIDWVAVEKTIENSVKQFYLMDMSQFGQEIINKLAQDLYFFASLEDKITNKLLGFITTSITPALPWGTIKIINLIISEGNNDGLASFLLSTVFKIIPSVKQITTTVRPTDIRLLTTYKTHGFTWNENPIVDPNHPAETKYLINLQYNTDESDILQNIAQQLTE